MEQMNNLERDAFSQALAALNHFETAAKINPHGLWGHKARLLANANS